jgi:peptidoglycan/xylan/chitin deacetylase (PgdA/CDA1 family)
MRRREILRGAGLGGVGAILGGSAVGSLGGGPVVWGPTVGSDTVAQAPLPGGGRARLWWSARTEARVAALSFDDGPTPLLTPTVLDLLAAPGVPATFFVIGELAQRHPDLVRRAHSAGHEIGNHGYDHRSAAVTGREAVATAMERGAEVVEAVVGRRPRWYRPPRGEVTSATVLAAARTGHDIALWSVVRDDGDVGDDDAAGVARHLVAAIHPGAVVDLHDGLGRSGLSAHPDETLLRRRRAELTALPRVLARWQEAGYRFVTLSELIPDQG